MVGRVARINSSLQSSVALSIQGFNVLTSMSECCGECFSRQASCDGNGEEFNRFLFLFFLAECGLLSRCSQTNGATTELLPTRNESLICLLTASILPT